MNYKAILTFLFFIGFFSLESNAQVTVSGAHTSSNGTYTTLKGAFDAINGQSQTAFDILVTITANTTETASAVLNAGAWSSINIYPTITGLSISGDLATPLIDLNGADNVTIDGRVNATGSTKDLIITNTSTSATAGTSTIRFINDATNNTVQYCTVSGSETDAASGVIFFSTTDQTSIGNDNNTITNNNLTHAGANANRPINIIYSAGSATYTNSNNTVSNNNIYDFFKHGTTSNGIKLNTNTSEWTISGNSFYETASFAASAAVTFRIIQILAGSNYSITNNYIGGSEAMCGGTAWTKTGNNTIFDGIYLGVAVGAGNESSVHGNVIANFSWTNTGSATWRGIMLNAGKVFLGSSDNPNMIGTETKPILVTAGATGGLTMGIYINQATVDAVNNTVSYITSSNGATLASHLYGIYKASQTGALSLVNCTVRNLTANSASSSNAQYLQGIYTSCSTISSIANCTVRNLTNNNTNAGGYVQGIRLDQGANTVTSNTISDLTISNPSTVLSESCSVGGIVVFYTTAGTTANQIITGNAISNLSNTYNGTSFTGVVTGMYCAPNAGTHTIDKNFIHSLSVNANATSSNIAGIYIQSGGGNATASSNVTYANNIISLGGNTATKVYGIYEPGTQYNNNNIYYNTVYISGSLSSGITNQSYALYSASNSNTRDIRNNLFVNARTTTAGINLHVAAYYNYANNTNLTCDYNDYYVSGTGGVLGYFNSAYVSSKDITGSETNSITVDPVFINTGSTVAADYLPTDNGLNGGVAITGVTADFSANTRSNKTRGALELLLKVVEVWRLGIKVGEYTTLKAAFDKINDGTHTGVLDIKITGSVIEVASAVLYQSGYNGTSSYTSIHIYPTSTGLSITGNLATPLIDLNGANFVDINGSVNETGSDKDLIISNSSISNSAGTSTIRFINDAQNNIIRYCTISGSETSTTSGVIFFSTTNQTVLGNYNIVLINNNLTHAGGDANRPINIIYSAGTAGFENVAIDVSDNNFYDFLKHGTASNAIHLQANTAGWSFLRNSFYETTSFIPTASVAYSAIRIDNASGDDFEIGENFIGGRSASCGGTAWTKTNAFNNAFDAIYVNALRSEVRGNTIKNIAYSNSSNASSNGINIISGTATVFDNVIGSSTGTGSIVYTNGGTLATAGSFKAITIASTSTTSCDTNSIGAITTAHSNAAYATNFYGISKESGAGDIEISGNVIGSTTQANSIQCSSASTGKAQFLIGIYSAGTGITAIAGNICQNLVNLVAGTAASKTIGINTVAGNNSITKNIINTIVTSSGQTGIATNAATIGIFQSSNASGTNQMIGENTILNIQATHATARNDIYGLYNVASDDGNNRIYRNFIQGFSIASSAINSDYDGIVLNAGNVTCDNNIISVGDGISNGYRVYGVFHNSGVLKLYYNTIVISGSVTSTDTYNSVPFFSNSMDERDVRNNLFINNRSGGTPVGTEGHRIIRIQDAGANLTLNYNDYYTSSSANYRINNSNYSDFSTFKTATGKDANSLNSDPQLLNNTSTSWRDYYPINDLQGINIATITDDFYLTTRELPMMGALEGNVWEGFYSTDFGTGTNWTSSRVPQSGKSIRFAKTPYNHCILDQNRIVNHIYNDQSIYDLVVNGKKLTIQGNMYFSNGAQIDAKDTDSEVEFNGDTNQTVLNNAFIDDVIENLTVNNTADITLAGNLIVNNSLNFTHGLINTGSNTLIMSATANTVNGACSNRYINGKCSKTGNNAFLFPIGKGIEYAPIGISAPSNVADMFTAEYFKVQPSDKDNVASTINHISDCEYWDLSRNNGTSSVQVTLSWDTRSCGVTLLSDLIVAHYIDSQWKDEGNTATTGDNNSGTVTSNTVSSFSPFTLASKTKNNILPVSLIDFSVICSNSSQVEFKWTTVSEANSSCFEIQQSEDAENWVGVGHVNSVGNSNQIQSYENTINSPISPTYYRLKIVDMDGSYSYSNIKYANCAYNNNQVHVYPNPIIDKIIISVSNLLYPIRYKLKNMLGVTVKTGTLYNVGDVILINEISSGIYFLSIDGIEKEIKVVKN